MNIHGGDPIKYNGKNYYHTGTGGMGIDCTYEITDDSIIVREEGTSKIYLILNLLSDGSLKVVYADSRVLSYAKTGWVYKPC